MRGWWQDFTDLVLPADCGGCGRARTALCEPCRKALYGAVPRRVRPLTVPPGLPVVHAAAPYADAARAVLLAHKERGALVLAGALGEALARAVRVGVHTGVRTGTGAGAGARAGEPLLLVPVPSARGATAARGHDPVRRIALVASRALRRDGVRARMLPVLRQRRAVVDQAGLDARARLVNMEGALDVVPGGERLLATGRAVLVDDLMTTGASLAEAARALRAVEPAQSAARATGAERRGGPGSSAPGCAGTGAGSGAFHRTLAAVVAASPDSFEINRN
ncbi:ComF family protein [Streptomyces sp. NPDC050418]|uniref:ComF family protein n=1 Tax=Streptomyces sp. NPDC050418 TaxID=3365612 RepID=UPI00378FDFCB